jgi:hypothetical protein
MRRAFHNGAEADVASSGASAFLRNCAESRVASFRLCRHLRLRTSNLCPWLSGLRAAACDEIEAAKDSEIHPVSRIAPDKSLPFGMRPERCGADSPVSRTC